MKFWFFLVSIVLMATSAFAAGETDSFTVRFSQEIVSVDQDGNLYPSVTIDPAEIEGMKEYRYDLGGKRALQVVSNIENAEEKGLSEVAGVLGRCYEYIEKETGKRPDKGVLLYLIEVEDIPLSYKFEASYNEEVEWSEVRMALIVKGESLVGPYASPDLTELIYDTIPHELGHDVLDDIDALQHDIDGKPSFHTRWFIDGVCETLAKCFARDEAPLQSGRFLAMRNVGEVMDDPRVREELFSWTQQNDLNMNLESDLYGASMLMLMAWTEDNPLKSLLDKIEKSPGPLDGRAIEALMTESLKADRKALLSRAGSIGRSLEERVRVAARGDLEVR